MSKSDNDGDEVPGTQGPCTCPLDLKSCDATLPDQSCDTNGQSPKMDAMQKMIDKRVATKFDDVGGMTGNNTTDQNWTR